MVTLNEATLVHLHSCELFVEKLARLYPEAWRLVSSGKTRNSESSPWSITIVWLHFSFLSFVAAMFEVSAALDDPGFVADSAGA